MIEKALQKIREGRLHEGVGWLQTYVRLEPQHPQRERISFLADEIEEVVRRGRDDQPGRLEDAVNELTSLIASEKRRGS